MITRRLRLLAWALTSALLVGACSSGSPGIDAVDRETADVTAPAPEGIERYVALGDSFTSAPLVPTTDVADGCFRSDSNYPALVAERLDIDTLVDVSCSGARTRDLTHPQPTVRGASVPPQLRALTRGTDLVTLGIGGNDFDLFATLIQTCTRTGGTDSTGSSCARRLEARGVDLVALAGNVGDRVAAALRRIQRRAPEATVLLVGYPRLVPARGACPQLPFAPADYELAGRVGRALDTALTQAARRTDAELVDVYAASRGHDICAEDPWVNGVHTTEGEALAYHPLAEGMRAVADQVVAALDR